VSAKPNLQPTLQALIDRDRRGLAEHPTPEELVDYHAGELPAEEQDDLRNHLVLCHDCADLLLDLVSFAEFTPPEQTPSLADGEVKNAWQNLQPRLMAREEPLPAVAQLAEWRREGGGGDFVPRRRLMQAYAIAATLLVGVVGLGMWAGSLQKSLQEASKPRIDIPVVYIPPEGGTRGGDDETPVIAGTKNRPVIALQLIEVPEHPEYSATLFDGTGQAVWEIPRLHRRDDETLTFELKDGLQPGKCEIRLFASGGKQSEPLAKYPLIISAEKSH